ncbi:L-rhamnose/proton symporter RhaT [Terrimonas rubra]|uniref:L-rhamnose/proton symporter RhaT n=1 Tax=Terrimonas rubra TaxID=1035890 RepID=A0ABW5ZZB8_9BACT
MEVINGILLHGVGASSAALCYTPQKQVRNWSWQTYWLAQAFVCWLALPVLIAMLTIPQLTTVLKEAPASAMINSFLLGMGYGIGGTAFGIAIRYVGFSLTYAISVGISCVLGTLIPPLVKGTLAETLSGYGANFVIIGIVLGAIGIALCGVAGRKKEKDLEKAHNTQTGFSLSKGLPICLLAGVLSAFYGFAIEQGQPIADIAANYGAGNLQSNVIYIFSNTGAFVTTALYCLYLHLKQKTFSEYRIAGKGILSKNYLMAAITGVLWYGQFFFYGLGHVRMGSYKFSSWAIHMIMLVLISSLVGILLKEWKPTQQKTKTYLAIALLVLLTAVLVITYGNYLGGNEANG